MCGEEREEAYIMVCEVFCFSCVSEFGLPAREENAEWATQVEALRIRRVRRTINWKVKPEFPVAFCLIAHNLEEVRKAFGAGAFIISRYYLR